MQPTRLRAELESAMLRVEHLALHNIWGPACHLILRDTIETHAC